MNREEEKLYKERKQSGKSVAEFGRERGIPLHRLYELSSSAKKRTEPAGKFVWVGTAGQLKVHVSESVYLEVPLESLSEVFVAIGGTRSRG